VTNVQSSQRLSHTVRYLVGSFSQFATNTVIALWVSWSISNILTLFFRTLIANFLIFLVHGIQSRPERTGLREEIDCENNQTDDYDENDDLLRSNTVKHLLLDAKNNI